MKKIRIYHVIGGLHVGGAERFLSRLVLQFDKERFDSTIISLGDIGPIGNELLKQGINVRAIKMQKNPLNIFRLFEILRKDKPDIVQTWLYISDVIAGLFTKAVGIPVVWGVRQSNLDADVNEARTLWYARIAAFLSRWIPVRVLYCADIARRNHVTFGYRSIAEVIPNGVNTDVFKPDPTRRCYTRKQLGVADEVILVGMVARYHLQKGHAEFINMASKLVKQYDNVRFVLVGKGMDNSNVGLLNLIEKKNLTDHLILAGHVDDIPRVMNGLDIYVSASLGEGWPNAVAEAMSCGLPCVATTVGDTESILNMDEYLVKPSDPDALVGAVKNVLQLDSKELDELKKNVRSRIVDHFHISHSVSQYQDLYLSILSK